MIVGTPIWLWLVLAAVIPLLIHLWNKENRTPRNFVDVDSDVNGGISDTFIGRIVFERRS